MTPASRVTYIAVIALSQQEKMTRAVSPDDVHRGAGPAVTISPEATAGSPAMLTRSSDAPR